MVVRVGTFVSLSNCSHISYSVADHAALVIAASVMLAPMLAISSLNSLF